VVMARMQGDEVAERVRELQPRTRVLYMSGYAQTEAASVKALEPILEKPFTEPDLLAKSIRSSRDQYRGPEFRAPFHRLSAVIRPLSLAPRSVQGDLQRSQQIVRFKRFEHHRVLMFQAGCRVSVSGKYHDRKRRRIGSGLDAVYQFQTAHQWQFEIDENKVRKLNIHDADGRPAIGCLNDFVIGSLYY